MRHGKTLAMVQAACEAARNGKSVKYFMLATRYAQLSPLLKVMLDEAGVEIVELERRDP